MPIASVLSCLGELLSDSYFQYSVCTELLNFQENLSTGAYKGVAYKKTCARFDFISN